MERRAIFEKVGRKYSPIELCKELIDRNPEKNFADYFKLAFVRNPYDRLASALLAYPMVREGIPTANFSEYVIKNIGTFEDWRGTRPMHPLLTINGNLAMDFMGRYENIQEDWSKACKIIGVPDDLPHMNRSGHDNYANLYSAEARELVYNYYKIDFKLFNYEK